MFKLVVFLVVLLTLQVGSNLMKAPSPRTMEDDANEQLDDLRATVRSAISTGQLELVNLINDAAAYRDDKIIDNEIALDAEYVVIFNKLQQIKEYYGNAGANMSSCLQWREAIVLELPNRCRNDMNACLVPLNKDLEVIQVNTNYIIDIIMSDVEVYGFLIQQCAGAVLCLTEIITQIQLAEASIPQKVQIELDRAASQVEALKVPIQNCMDASLAWMVGNGNGIVDYIGECLEDYLPDNTKNLKSKI